MAAEPKIGANQILNLVAAYVHGAIAAGRSADIRSNSALDIFHFLQAHAAAAAVPPVPADSVEALGFTALESLCAACGTIIDSSHGAKMLLGKRIRCGDAKKKTPGKTADKAVSDEDALAAAEEEAALKAKEAALLATAALPVPELTWLISQRRDASAPVVTGAAQKRRNDITGDALALLAASSQYRRYYRALLVGGRAGPEESAAVLFPAPPMAEAEFEEFMARLVVPLPMVLRLHTGDRSILAMAEAALRGAVDAAPYTQYSSPVPGLDSTATMEEPTDGPSQVGEKKRCRDGEKSEASCSNDHLRTLRALTPVLGLPAQRTLRDGSNGHGGPVVLSVSDDRYHSDAALEMVCRTGHSGAAWSFQEAVSTLPVAALDVRPGHRVLDLCSAPGSKSIQALDGLLSPDENDTDALVEGRGSSGHGQAASLLVINEKDRIKATQTLPSRLKKFATAATLVTRCDATQFPAMYRVTELPGPTTAETPADAVPAAAEIDKQKTMEESVQVEDDVEACGEAGKRKGKGKGKRQPKDDGKTYSTERLLFDRIVCDVPCSGDGTVRKDTGTWLSWSLDYAQSLVSVQTALLLRAFDMLAPGGIVAYSTCSMNPIEDEAVVLRLLRTFPYHAEVLNVNDRLRDRGFDLKSKGGLPYADPTAPDGTPPQRVAMVAERTLRMWPHKDDHGGFFVALIRRRPEAEAVEEEARQRAAHEAQAAQGHSKLPTLPAAPLAFAPNPKVTWNRWMNVKRYARLSASPAHLREWTSICHHFGIVSEITASGTLGRPAWAESVLRGQIGSYEVIAALTPDGQCKRLVLCTAAAAEAVLESRLYKGPGVELVATGVNLMKKYGDKFMTDVACRWRFCQEALGQLRLGLAEARGLPTDVADPLMRTLSLDARDPVDFACVKDLLLDGAYAYPDTPMAQRVLAVPQGGAVVRVVMPTGLVWLGSATVTQVRVDLTVDLNARRSAALLNFGIHMPFPGDDEDA